MPRGSVIRILLGFGLVLLLGVGGFYRQKSATIKNPAHWGETMGTTYSIQITGKISRKQLENIHRKIEAELAEINRQMSTWDKESEISRFNHSKTTDPFPCSADFAQVVRRALELSDKTGGAFDPTLQPLLNLWGFGSEAQKNTVPSKGEIAAVKQLTGWKKLSVNADGKLIKSEPELSLDLGAIAKGYGVDAVAGILNAAGLENWFVEIGGEVVVRGHNPDGNPWRIGIQFPTTNPIDDRFQGKVHLSGGAVATSGDYRNYIEEGGKLYSHILDPRTGQAVLSETASVTVIAPNCTVADGLATALFVMGADEGIALVETLPGIETMLLLRGENGEISERFSSGFKTVTRYTGAH